MICATKLNFSETGTGRHDLAIIIGLPLATGVLIVSGFISIVVIFFIHCHRHKEKLKRKEEADVDDTDIESNMDTRSRCKSSYHQANRDLSNSQIMTNFKRAVSSY